MPPLGTYPWIDKNDPYTLEIPDIPRCQRHAVRAHDCRGLAVELRNRVPCCAAGGCNLRVSPRRITVERKNSIREACEQHPFQACGKSIFPAGRRPDGITARSKPSSASRTEVKYMLDAAQSAIQDFSAGSGTGRINSDTTFLSRMNTEKPYLNRGGSRIGSRGGSSRSTPPIGAKQS